MAVSTSKSGRADGVAKRTPLVASVGTRNAEASDTTERSGGSVANTIAIAAALGADTGYVGKVSDDRLGGSFTDSIRSHGVAFTTPALAGSPATARCLIMVTPDGERTMSTFLGACTALGPDDIEQDDVAGSKVSLIEGYLADTEHARRTIGKIIDATAKSDAKVGLTLSDAGWRYGHEPAAIYATIVEGRPNGMPAFGGRIPDDQVWQLVAYVRSLSSLTPKSARPGRDDHGL